MPWGGGGRRQPCRKAGNLRLGIPGLTCLGLRVRVDALGSNVQGLGLTPEGLGVLVSDLCGLKIYGIGL
jgi:hypothetical protein